MLELKFSPNEEISIEGNAKSLLQLCSALESHLELFPIELPAKSDISPEPYHQLLTSLTIKTNSEFNGFSVAGAALTIEGNSDFFNNLKANIPWDAEAPEPNIHYHVHYDKISFGNYLSENSLDAIISKI